MAQTAANVLLGRTRNYDPSQKPVKSEGDDSLLHAASVLTECAQHTPSLDATAYEVRAQLGKGSFGAVYLVQHRETKKDYAMKVMSKAAYKKQVMMDYALREKNMHLQLRHPFIVGLHHAFQTSSQLVMLLSYCPGGSLSALLDHKRQLSEDHSRFYVAEVMLAVVHLHEHRLVHRDIKPANVLLDSQNHAMLTDFGLAKEECPEELNGLRSFAGTQQYLAPEVLARSGHGRLVDVYNLGTLAFELMTGRVPFYDHNKKQLRINILKSEIRCPSFFSASAKAFVHGAMAKQPEKRPGVRDTAELKQHVWFEPLNLDALLERREQAPKVRQHRTTRQGTPSPFLDEDTDPQEVAGWDHAGSSFRPLSNPGAEPRASCLFMPWRCLRARV